MSSKRILNANFIKTKLLKANLIKSNIIKITLLFLWNKIYLIPILVMLPFSIFSTVYKNQQFEEYEQTAERLRPALNLLSQQEKISFIKAHKFYGKNIDFNNFIYKIIRKTYSKMPSIRLINRSKIGCVDVFQTKVMALFWHDYFVFDFLEKLRTFTPGFLNIISVNIAKLSKRLSQSPTIKLEVICKVFQKL